MKNLRIWMGDQEVVIRNIAYSHIVGNHLFVTKEGMTHESGINLDEVIAWEFFSA